MSVDALENIMADYQDEQLARSGCDVEPSEVYGILLSGLGWTDEQVREIEDDPSSSYEVELMALSASSAYACMVLKNAIDTHRSSLQPEAMALGMR